MQNIYLTPSLKKYYTDDFNRLLTFKDKVWGLDRGLKEILLKINQNQNVQTLYSKFNQLNKTEENNLSYIEFCYVSDVELDLFRNVIPFFISKYNNLTDVNCYYLFQQQTLNDNFIENAPKTGIACLDDNHYFFINTIGVYLKSDNKKAHKVFWVDIENKLSDLNL